MSILSKATPLLVDLDGTVIKTDLLVEGFLVLCRKNPFIALFLVPIWLLRGRAHLKHRIAQYLTLNPALLPYNQDFLEYLAAEKGSGRSLILTTAANEKIARSVADHLGLFCDVWASTETTNFGAKRKLERFLGAFGAHGFGYAGNEFRDILIWKHAQEAILVNTPATVERTARRVSHVTQVFSNRKSVLASCIAALRPHQALKNLLIFVPLLMAHRWTDIESWWLALLAFFAFSFCASGMYVLNDLLDLPSDRAHPRKRTRPFASGDVSIVHGVLLVALNELLGVTLAANVNWAFFLTLMLYIGLTTLYTFRLKMIVMLDVLTLAVLYTLRVIGGGFATNIELSFWLLAFSMFIFLSLGLAKRCSELFFLRTLEQESANGRDYKVSDLGYIFSMGVTSGYIAVLVVALFINSPDIAGQYPYPKYLWPICPILLFWVSRFWLKTARGEMHDDPVVYAIEDKSSQIALVIIVLILIMATGGFSAMGAS